MFPTPTPVVTDSDLRLKSITPHALISSPKRTWNNSEILDSNYKVITQAGFIPSWICASFPQSDPQLTPVDQVLSSKAGIYFYNLDAPDDDRGLSLVIKDVGTFLHTDGKNKPRGYSRALCEADVSFIVTWQGLRP